jgi:superfamily I DNA/RNA helicase
MTLISKVYNDGFEHDHETRMFNRLVLLLEDGVSNDEGKSYLLGNLMINGADIDAVFIRPPSTFFIIEFKQGGGLLEAGENDKWKLNGNPLMSDRRLSNPFVQVRSYRRKVNQRLKGTSLYDRSRCMVMFSDQIKVPNLGSVKNIWFSLFEITEGSKFLLKNNFRDVKFDQKFVGQFLSTLDGRANPISLEPRLKSVFLYQKLGFQPAYVSLLNQGNSSSGGKAAEIFENLRSESYDTRENKFATLRSEECKEIKGTFFRLLGDNHKILVVPTSRSEIIFMIGNSDEMNSWVQNNSDLTFVFDKEGRVTKTSFDARAGMPKVGQDESPYLSRIEGFVLSELFDDQNTFLIDKLNASGPLDDFQDIMGFLSMIPSPDLRSFLKDIFTLLSQDKRAEAKVRFDCYIGDSVTLDEVVDSEDEILEPSENTDNLIKISDLSSEEWSRFVDPAKFQEWMLLLHPNQQRLVTQNYEFPVRLHGVSGSGKTSVLIHRAMRLAKECAEGEKVLIVTLSDALSELIKELVERLGDGEIPANLIVQPYYFLVGKILDEFMDSKLKAFCDIFDGRLSNSDGVNNLLLSVFSENFPGRLARNLSFSKNSANRDKWRTFFEKQEAYDNLDLNVIKEFGEDILADFIWDELTLIRSVAAISNSYEDYFSYIRQKRGITLQNPKFRQDALEKLKKWEGEMIRHGFIDEMTFTQAINFLVEQNVDFPSEFKFRSVLVDEYQDLSTFDIKFLERLVTVKRNGLFLTGDVAQKINAKQLELKKVIPTENLENRRLLKNYRNSKQVLEMAYSMLENVLGLEGEKISESPDDFKILKPEFAERESAKPFLVKTNDIFAAAWKYAQEWTGAGNAPFTSCIVTVSPKAVSVDEILKSAPDGVNAIPLAGDFMEETGSFPVAELEQVKGFEFMQVIILGAEQDIYPPIIKNKEISLQDHERDLLRLYVGITRARDEVRFIYKDEPSPFLIGVKDKMTLLNELFELPEPEPVAVHEPQVVSEPESGNNPEVKAEAESESVLEQEPEEDSIAEPEPEVLIKPEPFLPPETTFGDNMGHFNVLPISRPVTVWKMTEAMGQDPRTYIGISDHLRNVCGFEHGNPRRKEIADPYVLETLKRWKCTVRFI